MELVWKIVFHSVIEIFHSILASSTLHTEISIPYLVLDFSFFKLCFKKNQVEYGLVL